MILNCSIVTRSAMRGQMSLRLQHKERRFWIPVSRMLAASLWRGLGHPFDRRTGVHTEGNHQPTELLVDSVNLSLASEYAPSPVRSFWLSVASLRIYFTTFAFIDIGSGKGRALILASKLPFRRVEGVEFAKDLNQIALANITQVCRNERDRMRFRLHNMDIVHYDIPLASCVLYLFNPFEEPMVAKLAEKIMQSYHRYPRDIFIVYVNPLHRAVFDCMGFSTMITLWWEKLLRPAIPCDFIIYKLSASQAEPATVAQTL